MTLAEYTRLFGNRDRKGVAFAALFLFLCAGCGNTERAVDTVEFTGGVMGTTYHVKVVAPMADGESAKAGEAIESALNRVDGKMSTYKPDSELSQLNAAPAGAAVLLTDETFKVIGMAQDINRESGGAFDITVGPLVNAWGFGPLLEEMPSDEAVTALLALTGPDKIALDPAAHTVTKAADGVYCDLSAIAKGYAVDQVAEALDALGYQDFMVEVGGEVRTAGKNAAGVPWNIAVEKPAGNERSIQEVVGLSGVSMATSGDYRNFYMAGGKRVSHTIDPHTGRPVDHQLASASVIHPECALADAYATTLMVLGPEKGMDFAEARGLAVLLIVHGDGESDFSIRQTPAFAKYVVARP